MSSMSNSIENGCTFNPENIKYSKPKTMSKGGKNVKIINKNSDEWLVITTPLMLSFGISDFVDETTGIGNGRYELSQLFPIEDYENEETKKFLENMKKFEDKIKSDALLYSKEWFGKAHKSPEVIQELFTPMLKYSKINGEPNYNKPPSIRAKVQKYNEEWKCEIYSEDGEILYPSDENPEITPLDILKSGKKTYIATVLLCGGLWFTNGKFTVTWELAQAVTQKPKERVLGRRKCLIQLKPTDKEILNKYSENIEEENLTKNNTYMNDSESDNDNDNESNFTNSEIIEKIEPVEYNEVIQEEVIEEKSEDIQVEKKKKVVRKKSTNT